MRITIFGAGYVGLVTAACLAEHGNDVLCVDVDSRKIDLLRSGTLPIYEPGLEEMVRSNAAGARLRFTTDLEEAVAFGTIQMIAVGTPPDEDGSADLQHVIAAARTIGKSMMAPKVVVVKSTVPVNTADKVRAAVTEELFARGLEIEFSTVSNPEFLKEGAAINDFMRPDRIVIGTADERAREVMRGLYAPFVRNHERFIFMDIRSAELTKYAANAMLATRISFINELANLAEAVGADIEHVRKGIGSDPRIGYDFLYPGLGYGGSCFPKDVQALQRTAQEQGRRLRILEAVETVNRAQKRILVQKILGRYGTDLTGLHFALWGLSFKPNTDDMREAPSLVIINELLNHGATITAYDPVAMAEARQKLSGRMDISYADSAVEALHGADALIIATEWKVFRSPDFDELKLRLKEPVIFDGRNLYDPGSLASEGIHYYPIGRPQAGLTN